MKRKVKSYKVLFSLLIMFVLLFVCACNNSLTIKIYNDSGEVIDTITLKSGERFDLGEYGNNIKKPGYKFSCFTDEKGNVIDNNFTFNSDTNIYVKFEEGVYTCKFIVEGEVIKEDTYYYGDLIEYPKNPRKEPDMQYTYAFKGWDRDDEEIFDDITFNAIFENIINSYIVTFTDRDGSILYKERLDYGVLPEQPKVDDFSSKRYKYTFTGWDKTVETVKEATTYVATYERNIIKPVTTLEGLTVSFLGDSISTFYKEGSSVNSYYSADGTYYYPKYCPSMDSYDKTWWAKLYNNTGMKLGVNNSWSGSTAWGANSSSAMTDGRINTLNENGDPDIVVVFIGTNDCASTYTDQYNPTNYEKALNTIITKIRALCDADIFFVELVGKTTYKEGAYNARSKEFNAVIERVAKEQGCGLIPLQNHMNASNESKYFNDGLHLSVDGATFLAELCEQYIKEYYNID